MSGRVLSSHSVVSSSRTVRTCSPWGGQWIGHWRTTWSTVCSSAPHSQAAEVAISHLYRRERKRPTPVRRRFPMTMTLFDTYAFQRMQAHKLLRQRVLVLIACSFAPLFTLASFFFAFCALTFAQAFVPRFSFWFFNSFKIRASRLLKRDLPATLWCCRSEALWWPKIHTVTASKYYHC